MESETRNQFLACGFDENDAEQVKWFVGLTPKDRAELVKMSGLKKLTTFSAIGFVETIFEAREPKSRLPKRKATGRHGRRNKSEDE